MAAVPKSVWADLSAIVDGNHASIQETTKPSKGSPSKSSPSKGSPSKKLTPEESLLVGLKNLNIKEDGLSPGSVSGKRFLSTSSSTNSHSKDITHICRAAQYLQDKRVSKVVVLVGAGISTNSGIPDFRTPGSGLYDNLQQYDIPYAEAIFDIDYFHTDPYPFFTLAKELYPSVKYRPNYNHYFLRLLHEQGLLLRLYTQNIDGLERLAGIPSSKLVESHGSFSQATCTTCRKKYKGDEIKAAIFKDEIPICHNCQGTVKPDIVFFGEDLPKNFFEYRKYMGQADLVLIMGTSLEVQPFAGIINSVRPDIPRILFNMQPVGPFKQQKRTMDFTVKGDLTKNLESLVTQLGWQKEILKLLQESEGHEYAEQFHQDLKTSPLIDGGADDTPTSLSRVTKETDNISSKNADHLKVEKSKTKTSSS